MDNKEVKEHKQMKITAMLQMYNEFENGNLERYMHSVARYCDVIVVYDDASTDDSLEYMHTWADWARGRCLIEGTSSDWKLREVHIITAEKNDYVAEVEHKAKLLELAIDIGSDWIFRIDADEVIEMRGEEGRIRELCKEADKTGIDSYAFRNANLWRSPAFYRIDNSFNDFVSCRLWKNNGELRYNNTKRGLHQRAVPDGLSNEKWADIITLHYGFASDESIVHKYTMYRSHGQKGWELERLIDERTLKVNKSKPEWFRNPPPNVNPFKFFKTKVADKVPCD